MAYINGPKEDVCIFCDRPSRAVDNDAESRILLRGEHAYIMMNIYPYSTGHVMVIPYQHASRLNDVPAEVLGSVMQLAQRSEQALHEVYQAQGFNIGFNLGNAAGAGFADHLHLHIVPRWNGDTNYVTTLGDVRVIPECLDDTYQRLRAEFGALR